MKSSVVSPIMQIDDENLKDLVKEVKETVATDIHSNYYVATHGTFGIVDLWKCHKLMKTAAWRRKY